MKIKRRLRSAIESAAARTGVLNRFERGARHGFTILTYHRVLPAERCAHAPFPSLVMPDVAFREQMRRLASQFEVTTISAGLARITSGELPERPLVAVTFDDGYVDNATHAAPILNEFGLRGTFFLVHDFVVHGRELWFERVARLEAATPALVERLKGLDTAERERTVDELCSAASAEPAEERDGPMSRAQVLALIDAGHEIGSHTLTHPILTRSDTASLGREVRESKLGLEGWLGAEVPGFCYPNGDNDERVQAVVRDAGYRWACSTDAGRNHAPLARFELQRIDVTPSRVTDHNGAYSELAFRSEISLLRSALRGGEAR
ncbi:MAG: polysaccharide deacetylase family protein [Planctomycetes bacterium]|nr:polysaccharide deacetylase family protein [Planctomycetota bacterium]